MIEVIPAIIAHSQEELEQKIRQVENHVEKIHLDIMDGNFVSNTTVGIEELEKIQTNLKVQVHLMTSKPEEIVGFWTANLKVSEIIFHIEATDKPVEVIDLVKKAGKDVGVTLNPETTVDRLDPILDKVDFVQFMTVHPGNYGGEFVESVLGKISSFHSGHPNVKILVDGAMHIDTPRKVVQAGASTIIMGGHIFSEGRGIDEAIGEMR